MSYFEARAKRLERNEKELLLLADAVKKADPTTEVYHTERDIETQGKISSLVFFRGEEINSVSFHTVPIRWSGCGYPEHGKSHGGTTPDSNMPFTVDDVLNTFRPVTSILHSQPNEYFKSKEQYLSWCSYLVKY